MLDTTDFTENYNHDKTNNNNNYCYYFSILIIIIIIVIKIIIIIIVILAVHVDFSSWNLSQRRFFCHRILHISRISRKRDQVANLDQIVVSNSCQLSHFGLRNNSV